MGCESPVGVHHQLPAGQTCICFKAAQVEYTAGVQENPGSLIHRKVPKGRFQHLVPNCLPQGFQVHVRLMLAGNHHGGHPLGLAVSYSMDTWAFPSGRRPGIWPVFRAWVSPFVIRCASTTGRGRYSLVSRQA